MFFKNDANGLKVLNWWRDECIKWCFNRCEDGKFGDQKYLDDWTTRFEGVHELQHLGGGVAPWNMIDYKIKSISGKLYVKHKTKHEYVPLVFVHFHDVRFLKEDAVRLSGYDVPKKIIKLLYYPYIKSLMSFSKTILAFDKSINANATTQEYADKKNFSFRYKFTAYIQAFRSMSLEKIRETSKHLKDVEYINLNSI
jgi:hypothetical protein